MKTLVKMALLGSILLFSGWGLGHDKSEKDYKTVTVEVGGVGVRDIPEYATAIGTLASFQTATLSATVEGQVTKIFCNNGQDVKQGDLLVQLNDAKVQADLQSAQAELKL